MVKIAWFGSFLTKIRKNFCHIWYHLQICQNVKREKKGEMLKGKKKNLISKLPYLGILGLEFEKNFCHIWNQHPRLCQTAKFHVKQKILKFGTKNTLFAYLDTFRQEVEKNYCHTWNQHLRICENAMLKGQNKLWDQNYLIWVYLDWNLMKLLSYYQHPRIFQNTKSKFHVNFLRVGPKMPYLDTFTPEYEKSNVIFETNTLDFM